MVEAERTVMQVTYGMERTVGLVQINNSFSGQNYFPLSVGMLQAYAEKHLGEASRYAFLRPIYSRMNVEEAVERLSKADIVGFSTYMWNFNISLAIAKKLSAKILTFDNDFRGVAEAIVL